ncbi:MAG: DUF4386 domain-containing protein [Candidatus Hodarchaeales archaeon]|jgi:hypothetical protein
MSLELQLSGLFFYVIIITNILSNYFGYQTTRDLDVIGKLRKISANERKFNIGFVLILLEHFSIITLAVILFIALSPYNILLGVVWILFRGGEGSMQIYNKRNYYSLLNIARQYSVASESEKNTFIDLGHSILESKNSNFTVAQILFSIGTLAYSVVFVTSDIIPAGIGWFGIIASILYGLGNGMMLRNPDSNESLWNLGGLLILLFEIVLGGWLLFLL